MVLARLVAAPVAVAPGRGQTVSKAAGKALLQGGPLGGLLGGEDESWHVGFLWLLGRRPALRRGAPPRATALT